jgi:DNA-binding beta-propeller fold protein YncE
MALAAVVVALGASLLAQSSAPPPAPASGASSGPRGAPATIAQGPYHVEKTFNIGGDGGWDLLAVDPDAHRLYVPRGNRVVVVDTEDGRSVGEIPDTQGVHAVALAPALNKGFSSNGKAGTVTVFDLKALKVLQTVKAGDNPDAIVFEPVSKMVICFNGRSKDATVINAEDGTVAGTIGLGGKPELAVVDGHGKVFVNIEDTSEVLRLDPKGLKVEARYPLAPGEGPSGLAIDPVHKRLFAACGNEKLIVLDADSGKVLATPAIGKGVDGAEFDPAGYALTSNGEGTLSVVSTTADRFEVVQTLPTGERAKTLTIDPRSRRVYIPTAEFEAPKQGAPDAPRPRPTVKPGTFKVIVVSPETAKR